ncbi:MAG: GNAT family N-acetyltransferase, partial [Actinomycetota bacterium]
MSRTRPAIDIRAYRDQDEPAVLSLLGASLGGGPAGVRPPAFFRWKHLENPFGRSFMWVAEADDQIVGLRAFMRWEFTAGDRRYLAVRAVDTATHPAHQGQGIFSRLTLEALDALRDQADFVFNTPNERSRPGYLKMGWQVVGKVPIRVRVRRPIRFVTRVRSWRTSVDVGATIPSPSAPRASDVLADGAVDGLLAAQERPVGFATPRDAAYLG